MRSLIVVLLLHPLLAQMGRPRGSKPHHVERNSNMASPRYTANAISEYFSATRISLGVKQDQPSHVVVYIVRNLSEISCGQLVALCSPWSRQSSEWQNFTPPYVRLI